MGKKKKTNIYVDNRQAVGEAMIDLMNAAFQHGMAAQRLEDAQTDFKIGEHEVQQAASALAELTMTPTAKEIN